MGTYILMGHIIITTIITPHKYSQDYIKQHKTWIPHEEGSASKNKSGVLKKILFNEWMTTTE
jgi:hypothetical protein